MKKTNEQQNHCASESEPGRGSTFMVTLPCAPCNGVGQNGENADADA